MTKLTIDLADILKRKHPHGFHAPADIDIDTFLEFADDDWEHELDLTPFLAGRKEAAVILRAADVKNLYPHLTDEQAWEATEQLRDDIELFVEDAIADVVHLNFPSVRMRLHGRLMNLRYALQARTDGIAEQLLNEVKGLERLFASRPDAFGDGNPALEGAIAATLDDLESASREGGAA